MKPGGKLEDVVPRTSKFVQSNRSELTECIMNPPVRCPFVTCKVRVPVAGSTLFYQLNILLSNIGSLPLLNYGRSIEMKSFSILARKTFSYRGQVQVNVAR